MNRMWFLVLSVTVPVGLGAGPLQERPCASKTHRTLWVFVSPESTDLGPDLVRLRKIMRERHNLVIRPCLLVENFKSLKRPTKAFANNIRELRSLSGPHFSMPVLDEEGFLLAKRIGIERLPAFALIDRASNRRTERAHVLYGRGANLLELIRCKRR